MAENPGEEFILLDSDPIEHPEILQSSIFAKLRQSTFMVLGNFDGYLGRAAVLEVGYALGVGVTIFSVAPVDDPNIAPYCRSLSEVFPDVIDYIAGLPSALETSHA